jgi:hypothetical protein
MQMKAVYHTALDFQMQLQTQCYKCVESRVFSSLDQHMFDTTAVNNHIFTLIKSCSQSYVKICMHHLSKLRNAEMHKKLIRKQFSKLVLFNHQ